MTEAGYYRFPTIHQDTIVFVCEDDLWTVSAAGGVARRLTSNPGQSSTPALAPDGTLLAYMSRDEGPPEVFLMPATGGAPHRLTYLGSPQLWVVGWSPDGESIIFASNAGQPFTREYQLYAIHRDGGTPQPLPTGPAMSISYGPNGGQVIGRFTTDLARWKRYRGGLTGDLWIDPDSNNDWRRLLDLAGNVTRPLWVGQRIYFVSDHEGIGNLYSCLPTGEDLRRHTHHGEYYVRHPATDGTRIVYHAGADLFVYDPATDATRMIEFAFHSSQAQRNRKFVDTTRYLQSYAIHPEGHSLAIIARGKPFALANWEGAAMQYGDGNSTRYRLLRWLHDGKRLVMLSDATGEEALEVHTADASAEMERLEGLDIGRPVNLLASPTQPEVALSNQRNELILVNLETRTARVLDQSRYARMRGIAWSPDGRWLAYGFADTRQTSLIKLCQVETGETFAATRPVLRDGWPAFDPEGKYLYFLSFRDFDPVRDSLHFDLGFPIGMRPYLITLRADIPSPFIPTPAWLEPKQSRPNGDDSKEKDEESKENAAEKDEAKEETKPEAKSEVKPIQIDRDGISDRVIAFPVPAGRYGQIRGIKGKALFTTFPVEGTLSRPNNGGLTPARGRIEMYEFDDQNHEILVESVANFAISQNGKSLVYWAGNRLRVLKAGEKPKSNGPPSRKSGWIDLHRVRVSVAPPAEWEQMYREAWRLQRDQFWTADMSGVDWQTVYQRYLPLLKRVATRAEFSDLLWEMQGELGTSHAYEMGGDYRRSPRYYQGFLGADLDYDPETSSYRIARLLHGDIWDEDVSSPLARPGLNIKPGDQLLAINGRRLGPELSPQEALVNQAGNEVLLTLAGADGATPRTISVRTLRSETALRYREWVEHNRQQVHAATDGQVGYVHIPDMGARGYAEFHRSYLAEVAHEGLIVDVRFNGGGNVSQLILEKLARRRIGYDVQRWGEPSPYPDDSVLGPLVAIANEQAGSDGDMFSHAFKLMNLGPLIGKRTWGGVIGINVRDSLVDGGVTTQPEFSFWFQDVGWGLENHGTEPTIEVDIRPQEYVAGQDPQLERAIAEIQRLLEENPPQLPDFGNRPRLELPRLPGSEPEE